MVGVEAQLTAQCLVKTAQVVITAIHGTTTESGVVARRALDGTAAAEIRVVSRHGTTMVLLLARAALWLALGMATITVDDGPATQVAVAGIRTAVTTVARRLVPLAVAGTSIQGIRVEGTAIGIRMATKVTLRLELTLLLPENQSGKRAMTTPFIELCSPFCPLPRSDEGLLIVSILCSRLGRRCIIDRSDVWGLL